MHLDDLEALELRLRILSRKQKVGLGFDLQVAVRL